MLSPQDATVNPTEWQKRKYLPPQPTEWAWYVTPLKPGDLKASLEVRPILVVGSDGESETTEFATQRYSIDITVQRGLWDRITSLTTQAQALLALITVLSALAVALGIRRWGPSLWRRMRGESDPDAPVGDESDPDV